MSILESAAAAESPADRSETVSVCVAGHELTVFVESASLVAAMVSDIAAAKQRVWLESYIVVDDAAGQAVAAALAERARAGVDVRVLHDGFGCLRTPRAFFEGLSRQGVQVHGFHSFWHALRQWDFLRVFNRRDHRKLLIIDDRIAYFGGMNIVDQRGIARSGDSAPRHLPSSGAWRDVHVRLSGRRQSEIAKAFDRLWRHVHHQSPEAPPPWPLKQMLGSQGEGLFFFDCRPALPLRRPQRVFARLIRTARRNITVSVAYFIPQGKVLRELVKARKRGVTVSIVIPGRSDVPAVQCATRHFYGYLLKRGFRIYEQTDSMLHSKVMVIDQEWSIIGSCNLDPRSLFINLEFLAAIHSSAVAAVMETICHFEMSKSRLITSADVDHRPWWRRFGDHLAWTFRMWL